MRRRRLLALCGNALLTCGVALPGCGRTEPSRPAQQAHRDSPRARFDWIMVRFKRHFSSFDTIIPTRLGSDGEPRRLQLRFVVEDISYRVDGDDEPTAACTAQMTVRTSTHYSLLAADAGADEPGALEDRPNGATADPRETQRRHEPRDRDPPAGPGRLGPAAAEALLQLKTEQVTKTYDFVYTGGRWILKTENVDPSVLDALNYAIRNQ